MAMDFYLEVDTALEQHPFSDEFFRGVSQVIEDPDEDGAMLVRAPNFLASVYEITSARKAFARFLSIDPKFHIYFFNITSSETLNGYHEILKVVIAWLSKTNDDLALIAEEGQVLILRKSGQIVRHDRKNWWADDDLKIFSLPHLVKQLPIV